ncbi:putative endo-polygalacturonase [Zopfochytrium polystomum]|nr:putative endo-polygalacturonase [Zopfochytrium polystomum]
MRNLLPLLLAILTSLLAGLTAVAAAPMATPITPCVVSSYDGLKACLTSTNIVLQGPFIVPANKKIDMSKLKKGTNVTVKGLIKFAHSTKLTKSDFLFTLGGEKVTLDGTKGTLHGSGSKYWDTKGTTGVNNKPMFVKVITTGHSLIKGLTVKNPPANTFKVAGSDTILNGIHIDSSDGDKKKNGKTLGSDTNGFDVTGHRITILSSIIKNQADCLTIPSGTQINFLNNTCSGGTGISVGAVASNKAVTHVRVENCTVANSDIGIRIKTLAEAEDGKVSDVLFRDIKLKDIRKRGVVIRQDFLKGASTGSPTDGVPITNVRLTNVQGNMAKGATHSTLVMCAACEEFKFTKVRVTGAKPSCIGVKKSLEGCHS